MNRSFESYNNNRRPKFNSSFEHGSPYFKNNSPESGGFIPLESSSPVGFNNYGGYNNNKMNANRRKWRLSNSPDGFQRDRQPYYSPNSPYRMNKNNQGNRTPISSRNNSFTRNNRMNYTKNQFNVSDYFNPESIFEDPWEDLLKVHQAKLKNLNESIDSSLNTTQDSTNSTSLNVTSDYNCSQGITNNRSSSEDSIDETFEKTI